VLVRPDGDGALLITQQAHAWVSGQLARAWGNESFDPPEPREEVCLAAEQHDLGMASFDMNPTVEPDNGLPTSFMDMPLDLHLEIWTEAPRLMLVQDRYAAILVALHGIALYERRDLARLPEADAERVRDFLAAQRAFVDAHAGALGIEAAELERNQRLVWTFDSLSLALLLGWDPFTLEDVPARGGERVAIELRNGRLSPWPFSPETVSVRCDGWRVAPNRRDHEWVERMLRPR
jgi:hypothetical protein